MRGSSSVGPNWHQPTQVALVVHEGGVRAALPDATFLLGPVLRRGLRAPDALGVKAHAPAAAPDAIVTLDQPREARPRRLVERLDPRSSVMSGAPAARPRR